MIKIISNKTSPAKIDIQSKFLRDKTNFITPTDGLVTQVKQNTLLFVYLKISGLLTGEIYNRISLAIAYEVPASKCELQVISCKNATFTESYMKEVANSITGNETIEDRATISADEYSITSNSTEKNIKIVTFDVTKIARQKLGNNPQIMFVIKTDYTGKDLNIYDPAFVAKENECCSASTSNFGGLNRFYKYENVTLENVGSAYVNMFNQNLIFVVNGLTSLSSRAPISYSTIYNNAKTNEKAFLAQQLTPSFQYTISLVGNDYSIEDASGNRNYYRKIDTTTDEGKEFIKTYKIKNSNKDLGTLYFCNVDNSYFYLNNSTSSLEKINYYDQAQNHLYFEVTITSGARFTKLITQSNKFGDTITYNWNDQKLNTIKNKDEETVVFSYDTSDRISTVYFKSLNQYIEYSYVLSQWRINIAIYSGNPEETTKTLLTEAQLNYNEYYSGSVAKKLLSNVEDKITGEKVSFDQNYNAIISGMTLTNGANRKMYSSIYSYSSYCMKVTPYNNKNYYYYFDEFGRCKLEMDYKCRTITYNYQEISNDMPVLLNGVSSIQTNSRNLLENHSFENDEELFTDSSFGWKREGDFNSIVKTMPGGVYGNKYLFIHKEEDDQVFIYQEGKATSVENTLLKGFIKYKSTTENKEISEGNIIIRVSGTFEIDETGPKRYLTEYRKFSGKSDWTPFEMKIDFPSNALNITFKVEFILSGLNSFEVSIDDLQLCCGKQKVRYNLIENGYLEFEENKLPKGFLFSETTANDQLVTELDDAHHKILGEKVMKFEGIKEKYALKKMRKEVQCKGLAGDHLIFSVFGKANVGGNSIFRSTFTLYDTNNVSETYYFDFDKNFKNWQMLTRAITAKKDYQKVIIGIDYDGGSDAYFDAFQLYKDAYGKYYNHDIIGNITEVIDDSGNSTRLAYDEDNNVREVFSTDGSCMKYNYDTNGRLESVTDLEGNQIDLSYDTNDYINKIVLTPSGATSDEVITISKTNNIYGACTSLTDEFNNKTTYTLNSLNQLQSLLFSNTLTLNYLYNNDLTLNNINATVNGTTIKNNYLYDEKKNIKTINGSNGTKYDLTYDEFQRINKIECNGEVINQFKYDKVTNNVYEDLITYKQYGTTGDYFEFSYNNENQIETISLNQNQIVKYIYNEEGQICQVDDTANKKSLYYSYDLKGNIIKIVDKNSNMFSYIYDNLNNVQKANYKIYDTEKSFDYEYSYEQNEYTKEGYINRLGKAFGDEIIKGGSDGLGSYGLRPKMSYISEVFDSDLQMNVIKFNRSNQFICYEFSKMNMNRSGVYSNDQPFDLDKWQKKLLFNKTAYVWVKPTGTLTNEILFSFFVDYKNTLKECSNVKILSTGKIQYYSYTDKKAVQSSTNSIQLNVWNLIAIKLFKDNYNKPKALLFVNGIASAEFSVSESVETITAVAVFAQNGLIIPPTPTTSFVLGLNICLMSFGAYDYTVSDFNSIYNEGLKYLIYNNLKKKQGVAYYNSAVYQNDSVDFDVITLNGSLESTRGNKPVSLMKADRSFKVEKAMIFKYEPVSQRHLFATFEDINTLTPTNSKTKLAYHLGLGTEGIISFKFMLASKSNSSKKYLLTNYNNGYCNIEMYIDSNNESFCFIINRSEYTNQYVFEYNQWYTLTFVYSNSAYAFYINGERIFRGASTQTMDLSGAITYLGSNNNGDMPLNGYFEMLAYSEKVVTESAMDSLAKNIYENGNMILARKTFDSLGRITEINLKTNKDDMRANAYYYDKSRIYWEIERSAYNAKYQYDSMGNIIVKDIYQQDYYLKSETYEYDKLQRLVKEKRTDDSVATYSYDTNGNILTYKVVDKSNQILENKQYVYSSTIKDRLLSIKDLTNNTNIREFTYDSNHGGYPISITKNETQINLVWEGKRLKKYGNIEFFYNDEGIRIGKGSDDFYEEYILEGSKIVGLHHSETNGLDYKIYFNYDESGKLVGASCEGKEYFYIHDITGNITKIVDEDFGLIAQYEYDAFGKRKPNTFYLDKTIIGKYNPFVYKDYFYDAETELYYLQTRYYDPNIFRFISPDEIAFLGFETVGELNLYSYCGNNPIMYADPSGYFIITALIIGAIVGASIGFGVAAYIDYKDDGEIFNGSVEWYDYLGATVLGGLIGAGIGYIAPQIGSALSSFAAHEFTLGAGAYFTASGGLAMTTGLTITGTQIIQGVSALSGIAIMSAVIGRSGGYRVEKNTSDHNPPHVHIYGDDIRDQKHGIRIGLDGKPLPGQQKLPPGARKALKRLWDVILKALSN